MSDHHRGEGARPRRAVVITAVGLRCAAGSQPLIPCRLYGGSEPFASALGVPAVARVEGLDEDPRFPDDRKGALAWAAAMDAAGAAPPGGRRGVWLGTGLSCLTPRCVVTSSRSGAAITSTATPWRATWTPPAPRPAAMTRPG